MIKRLLYLFIFNLGLLCFSLFFIVIFVNATEIDCTRQLDETYTCQFRKLFLGKVQVSERDVEHIVGITVEEDSCFEGCGYRAEFVTAEGKQVPLSEVYTDQGPAAQQANTIGSQLDRNVDPITYREEPSWWVLILIGGLELMFLLLSPLMFLRKG